MPDLLAGGLITSAPTTAADPNFLLGTAPVFDLEPRSNEETARFAFIVPVLNIADQHPGRGADRRRLRPAHDGVRDHPADAAGRGATSPSGASRPP